MNLGIQIEKNEEYDKLLDSLVDLKEIQNNVAGLLVQQNEQIDSIQENMFRSDLNIQQGLDNLIEAKKLQFSYKPIIIGGVIGGVIGGPVGFLTGLKMVGLTTGTGSLLGGISGYLIQ